MPFIRIVHTLTEICSGIVMYVCTHMAIRPFFAPVPENTLLDLFFCDIL